MDSLCKSCGTAMDIDHAVYEADGDNSADTKTTLFHVPLYRCRNPNCARQGVLVRGERVSLPTQEQRFDAALVCCDATLLTADGGVVRIADGVSHRRDGSGFVVCCPNCKREQRFVEP